MIYHALNLEVDTEKLLLTVAGEVVKTEPQIFDLIVYLLKNRERVVTRDELLEQIWTNKVVTDASISNAIKVARKSLGDDGKSQNYIKTIHRRGYQFVASVDEPVIQLTDSDTLKSIENPTAEPLIALLPFQNLSKNVELKYFAEGLSEDLITELSRFKSLQVLSRHTSFQLNQDEIDLTQARNDYSIDYVIKGSVRVFEQRFKLNIQLIDTKQLNHVWAEKYEHSFEQIYKVQDEIIEQVVSIVAGQVVRLETGRALARSSKNLTAYDYFLRGLYFHKTTEKNHCDHFKAMEEFQKAIDLDNHFARARVWYCCARVATWDSLTEDRLDLQIKDVQEALKLNEHESECHRLLGMLYHYKGNDDLAEIHHAKALSLSPNDAYINLKSGLFLTYLGDYKAGLKLANRAKFLNPLHPSWYWFDFGLMYFANADYKNALNAFKQNTYSQIRDQGLIAACHVALGDLKAAQKAIANLLNEHPKLTQSDFIGVLAFKDQKMNQLIVSLMQQAGLSLTL